MGIAEGLERDTTTLVLGEPVGHRLRRGGSPGERNRPGPRPNPARGRRPRTAGISSGGDTGMRRRHGRGRSGPGLLGGVARTAVVAGTASAVAGRVAAGQEAAAQREQQSGAAAAASHAGAGPGRRPGRRGAGPPAPGPSRTVDELHAQLTKRLLGGVSYGRRGALALVPAGRNRGHALFLQISVRSGQHPSPAAWALTQTWRPRRPLVRVRPPAR
jgi:hypothetical protein